MINFEITYLEPDGLRPYGNDISVADVALKLESRYHLIENFNTYIQSALQDKISEIIMEKIDRIQQERVVNFERELLRVAEWLKGEWRDYMINELHGIKTRAADLRGDGSQSFIDTGNYYDKLQVGLRIVND